MMADHDGRDGKMSKAKTARDEYVIDLENHSSSNLDEVIQDAVEAVDRGDDPEPAGESASVEGSAPEAEALRERLLRTLADFDNYRKRAEREKETLRRMGIFDVVKDFLGVIDNLERALESSGNVKDLKQGLRLILRQQDELLRRHGVEPIDTLGKPFDPTVHEAVAHQETPEVDEPTVTRELQKGYLLHDRLLRPAMVHVSMPARGSSSNSGSAGDAADGDGEAGASGGEVSAAAGSAGAVDNG